MMYDDNMILWYSLYSLCYSLNIKDNRSSQLYQIFSTKICYKFLNYMVFIYDF